MPTNRKRPLLIGSRWTTPNGRIWEVVEMVKPGLYRVRTTDLRRVGEMYAGDIRRAIAKANGGAPS